MSGSRLSCGGCRCSHQAEIHRIINLIIVGPIGRSPRRCGKLRPIRCWRLMSTHHVRALCVFSYLDYSRLRITAVTMRCPKLCPITRCRLESAHRPRPLLLLLLLLIHHPHNPHSTLPLPPSPSQTLFHHPPPRDIPPRLPIHPIPSSTAILPLSRRRLPRSHIPIIVDFEHGAWAPVGVCALDPSIEGAEAALDLLVADFGVEVREVLFDFVLG